MKINKSLEPPNLSIQYIYIYISIYSIILVPAFGVRYREFGFTYLECYFAFESNHRTLQESKKTKPLKSTFFRWKGSYNLGKLV